MLAVHNVPGKKKSAEKALIPLPPTGFASLFCAKARAMKTPVQPRPAAGTVGVAAIARSARFCKKEQRHLHCVKERRRVGQGGERPVRKGFGLKNLPYRMFSISELVALEGNTTPPSPLAKRL